jgi:hypothetical protein
MDMKRWITSQADRVGAVLALVVGALALWGGYRGISDAIYPGQQLPYIISGGLVGLFLIGLAAALWLSADLRDEWRKLDEVNTNLEELLELARRSDANATPAASTVDQELDEDTTPAANGRKPARRRTVRAR